MTNEKLEILVVEDNPEFQKMCRDFVDLINTKGRIVCLDSHERYVGIQDLPERIQVEIVKSKDAAIQALESRKYSGSVCDVFFPSTDDGNTNQEDRIACQEILRTSNFRHHDNAYEISRYIESLNKTDELIPLGTLVGRYVLEHGIFKPEENMVPFIFCTNSHHHGIKTQAVTEIAATLGLDKSPRCLGMVDTVEGITCGLKTMLEEKIM